MLRLLRQHHAGKAPFLAPGSALSWVLGGLIALVLSLVSVETKAAGAEAGRYLAEHLAFELAGVGSWRASWADNRNPGFQIAGGGAEMNLGMEFDNGLGFLIGTRALFQSHLGADQDLDGTYAEVLGQALGQLRITDWVRVGLGANAGRLWRCCSADVMSSATSSLLFGGFLRVGVDFLPLSGLPRALTLWLRVGVDGHLTEDPSSLLPTVSMNMALGLGMRL
jgi:hypothetical protein